MLECNQEPDILCVTQSQELDGIRGRGFFLVPVSLSLSFPSFSRYGEGIFICYEYLLLSGECVMEPYGAMNIITSKRVHAHTSLIGCDT